MASKAGHTAGPCAVVAPSLPRPTTIGAWICTVGNNINDPAVFSTALGPHGELLFGDKLADANLIAEAFNVAHETSLTPRQLAEQWAELLGALKIASSCLATTTQDSLYDNAKATIRAALSKATAGGAV